MIKDETKLKGAFNDSYLSFYRAAIIPSILFQI